MTPSAEIESFPFLYLEKYSPTQYRLHVVIKLPADRTFKLTKNRGLITDRDADYYLIEISHADFPGEEEVSVRYIEDITREKDKLAVLVYDHTKPDGEKKRRKVKVSYADADEGGSGEGE